MESPRIRAFWTMIADLGFLYTTTDRDILPTNGMIGSTDRQETNLSISMKNIFPIALIALFASGCSLDCEFGKGAIQQQELKVAAFTKIQVEGSIDVIVEKGDSQRVTVDGEANLISLIKTDVNGDTWRIGTSKCYTTTQGLTVHIVTPNLSSIDVEGSGSVKSADVFPTAPVRFSCKGSGDITIDGINTQELKLDVEGSGAITLKGTCSELEANLEGSGDLHGKDLAANEAKIDVSGSGSATITAITKLDAKVQGSGEIRYAGKPEVNSKVEGSGSVVPL